MDVLNEIIEDGDEKGETNAKAVGLSNTFDKLETGILTEIWDCLLSRFDAANKILQSATMSLNTVVEVFQSLK